MLSKTPKVIILVENQAVGLSCYIYSSKAHVNNSLQRVAVPTPYECTL